jgi:23S rRNA maturation-related 3'-5' exoribonuclease YhaM
MAVQSNNEVWENRCRKLRTYLRQMVDKAEQYENANAQQARLLEVFQERHQQTTERANQLARSYKKLNEELKIDSPSPHDTSTYSSVHEQLGSQLLSLAAELQHASFQSP